MVASKYRKREDMNDHRHNRYNRESKYRRSQRACHQQHRSVAEYRKRYSVRIEVGHWRRIKNYTQMLEDSKKAVRERLVNQAEELGANAIVGLRFELSAGQGTSELIGYGTAVVIG